MPLLITGLLTAALALPAAPLPSAGGPYGTAEGDSVTLSASGSEGVYAWDIDGDGTYGDATGTSPTLTWAQLRDLGLGDGPADASVRVQVADAVSAAARLHVANSAPTAAISGPGAVPVSGAVTLTVSGDDVPEDDLLLVLDWGDGNRETLGGARERTASHTYAAPGAYVVALVVRDDDGGQSAPAHHPVYVAAAAVPIVRQRPAPVAQSVTELSVNPRCVRASGVQTAFARAVLVRFRLATAAAVQLTLERRRDRSGAARCPPARGRPGGYAPFSTRTLPGRAGAQTVTLGTRLRPGSYRLTVTSAGASARVRLWVTAPALDSAR